jgi:hypothetical protein
VRDTIDLRHRGWAEEGSYEGPIVMADDFYFGYVREHDGAWQWEVLARDTRSYGESCVLQFGHERRIGLCATRDRAVSECRRAVQRSADRLAESMEESNARLRA